MVNCHNVALEETVRATKKSRSSRVLERTPLHAQRAAALELKLSARSTWKRVPKQEKERVWKHMKERVWTKHRTRLGTMGSV